MHIDLSGKRAVVTGSTSGMGYAIAKGLAEAGAAVVVHGRSDERVAAACARLAREVPGAELSGHAADLADAGAVSRLIADVPQVDILVNNAGPIGSQPFFETTDGEWQHFLDVYVMAAVHLARYHARQMIDRGWGRVLFSAGVTAGFSPGADAGRLVCWGACKAALLGLSRGLSETAAGTGVTVNAFIPGPTHTEESYVRYSRLKPGACESLGSRECLHAEAQAVDSPGASHWRWNPGLAPFDLAAVVHPDIGPVVRPGSSHHPAATPSRGASHWNPRRTALFVNPVYQREEAGASSPGSKPGVSAPEIDQRRGAPRRRRHHPLDPVNDDLQFVQSTRWLHRIRDGKIREQWTVGQPVPETALNDNTMF